MPSRDVTLSCVDFGGDGPPLLLSHANGFCAAPYALLAEHLVPHFHVLAYDGRGHGDSSSPAPPEGYVWAEFVEDLHALMEALEPEFDGQPVYGVGHSFGGTVTLAAAAARPERFARIALLDPVLVHGPRAPGHAPPPNLIEGAKRRRAVWSSRAEILERWSSRPPFASWEPRALELYVEHGFGDRADGQVELKCRPEVEAAVYAGPGGIDPDKSTEQLACPGLLLFAEHGNFPRDYMHSFGQRSEHLDVVDVALGHLMAMESPGPVAEHLLRFANAV